MISFPGLVSIEAFLKKAEAWLGDDPEAQALHQTATQAVSTAKGEALGLASDGVQTAITDALTPIMGADAAKAIAASGTPKVIAEAEAYAAPVVAEIEHDLGIPEAPTGAA